MRVFTVLTLATLAALGTGCTSSVSPGSTTCVGSNSIANSRGTGAGTGAASRTVAARRACNAAAQPRGVSWPSRLQTRKRGRFYYANGGQPLTFA
jgi:hypothetical protein